MQGVRRQHGTAACRRGALARMPRKSERTLPLRVGKDCHVGIGVIVGDGASTGRWADGFLRS